jgi:hypothetical protein
VKLSVLVSMVAAGALVVLGDGARGLQRLPPDGASAAGPDDHVGPGEVAVHLAEVEAAP